MIDDTLQILAAPAGLLAWYDQYDGTMRSEPVVVLALIQEDLEGDVFKRVVGMAGEGSIVAAHHMENFIGYTPGGEAAPPEWRELLRSGPEAEAMAEAMKRRLTLARRPRLKIVPKSNPEDP